MAWQNFACKHEHKATNTTVVFNLLWIILRGTSVFWEGSAETVKCQSEVAHLKGMGSHGTNLMPVHSSTLNRSWRSLSLLPLRSVQGNGAPTQNKNWACDWYAFPTHFNVSFLKLRKAANIPYYLEYWCNFSDKVIELKSCFKQVFSMFTFHVLSLLGSPAFKVLQKMGDKILFQVSRKKIWLAQWKS